MEREDYLDKINSLTSVIEQFKEFYSQLKSAMESSEKRNEASYKGDGTKLGRYFKKYVWV